MDLDARVGQVWVLNDGETVELIVRGVAPVGRLTDVRWTTLVLWTKEEGPWARESGELDQAGESAFTKAEKGIDPAYCDWKRIL